MKILLVTDFSYPSICGVWNRVYNDAKYLIGKGHDVHVFSSKVVKCSKKRSSSYEEYEGIKIHRFKAKRIDENILSWKFKDELIKLNPDIIHVHSYRHLCAHRALKYAKLINKPCYLTTHAPFVDRKIRGNFKSFLASMYDRFYSKELNEFKKVVTITKWEEPFLFSLGVNKEKIVYIPNSVPNYFFIERLWSQRTIPRVLFLGRVDPIKNIECLIRAVENLEEIHVDIVGPYDEGYYKRLKLMLVERGASHRIKFLGPVFNKEDKIKLFSLHDVLVLPSKREAMPQSLVEGMAAGLIVVSSTTDGGKELVKHGETGYLFEINDHRALANILKNFKTDDNLSKKAKVYAERFKEDVIGAKLLDLYLKN